MDQLSAFPDDEQASPGAATPRGGLSAFPDEAPDPLARTLTDARKTPADQAARVFNLQLKTGLPRPVIERNLDQVEREASRRDFDPDRFRRESPLLAQWLQDNPQHAAIAQDDLEQLSAIERTLRVGRLAGGALAMGPGLISEGVWGATRAGAEVLGMNDLAAFARDTAVIARHLNDKVRSKRDGVGFVEGAIYGGLESLSTMAFAAAGGAALAAGAGVVGVGGAAAGAAGATAAAGARAAATLGIMGTATGGTAYSQAREDGSGVGKALTFASWQAAVEVLTEKIPAEWFFKDIAKNATFRQVLTHQIKSEMVGEQIATALQDLGEWVTLSENKDKTFTDYLAERPSAAAETAIATIVAVGGQSALGRAAAAVGGKPVQQQVLEDLHAQVGASATHASSPDAMRAFLSKVSKDIPSVYVDGRKFAEFFQQDAEALAAELTGDGQALRLALASGSDIAIPTATYLTKVVGSGHEPFFTEEVRFGPDAENTREARERMAREGAAGVETTITPQRRVFDAMKQRLEATGRVSPQEADSYATLWSLFYQTMAQGQDTDAFADRFIDKLMPYVSSFVGPYANTRQAEGGRSGAVPTPGADVNVEGGIPSSRAGRGETGVQRAGRRATHLNALASFVTREARREDPNVDEGFIRELLDERLGRAEEMQAVARENGRGQDLLRAIAGYGGLRIAPELEDRGELQHLSDFADTRERRGGVRASGSRTWNGVAGVFADSGITADRMTRSLMQDERFSYLEDDVNRLYDAIAEAMAAQPDVDEFPGTDNLQALGVTPGTRWWEPTSQTSETAATSDDISFDPSDFLQQSGLEADPRVAQGFAASTRNAATYGDPNARSTSWLLARRALLEERIVQARAAATERARAGEQDLRYDVSSELELQWVNEVLDTRSDRDTATPAAAAQVEGEPGFNPGPEFQPDQTPGTAPRTAPPISLDELAAAADATPERATFLQQRRGALEQRVMDARRAGRMDIAAENELRRLRGVLEDTDLEMARLRRDLAGDDPDVVFRPEALEFAQDDAELTDEQRSRLEWRANADRVAADPAAASATDLHRAIGYLSHRRVALVRQAEHQGRPVEPEVLAGIEADIQRYTQMIVEQRGPEFHQDLLEDGRFYSRIVKAVEDSTTAKAPGKQWKATIRNAKSGINQDEFALARVEDLEDPKVYTKAEVLQYLAANLVSVQDVTLADIDESEQERQIQERADQIFETLLDEHGEPLLAEELDLMREARERAEEELEEAFAEQNVRFEAYVLDGADPGTYREVFLTAPPATTFDPAKLEIQRNRQSVTQGSVTLVYDGESLDTYGDDVRRVPSGAYEGRADDYWIGVAKRIVDGRTQWRDGHDDYSHIVNPIVRLRLDVRTLPDGRRVLFLEEVQPPGDGEFSDGSARGFKAMPELFQRQWRELAFKWALRHAAANGLDQVAWTTGAQQVARYNLRRVAERIDYYPQSRQLAAYGKAQDGSATNEVLREHNVAPEDLPRYVGEELAARLLASQASEGLNGPVHRLEGGNLEVGGEGLTKLYDVDFRNVVQKLPVVKKHGGKVGITEITTMHLPLPARGPSRRPTETNEEYMARVQEFRAEWLKRHPGQRESVHAIAITPEMREAVLEGQALFQDDGTQPPAETSETSETDATPTPAGWDRVEAGPEPAHVRPGRQTKGTYNPTTNVIRLLKAKNRSTFLHESAHAFLEIMSELALEEGAPPRLQRDMATLLQWFEFDGDLKAWRALSHEERRSHHEKFARGFEAYLFEGRAPAPELQPLYARFGAWLLRVYKSIARLHSFIGGEIPADVRQVFDRMLATEEAIAAAEQDAQVAPLFTTAADAGVSEVEFQGYQDEVAAASIATRQRLEAQVIRELQREQEAAWLEERARVREDVAADVRQQPVFRAMAAMRGELEGFDPAPLAKDLLVAQFGRGILRQLPRPYLYSSTSGLPADTLAQAFGFPSGQALLEAIIAAPDVDEVIDEQTDDRMLAEYGSVLKNPQLLANQARDAVAGEHRDRVVRAELAMLRKLRRAAAPSVRAEKAEQRERTKEGAERIRAELPDDETLRGLAVQTIAGMKLGNIRPDRFLGAARRASREATLAAAKQDIDKAIGAKQTELTNLALYRAAVEARQTVEDARDRFEKMFRPDDAMAKRRQIDYVNAARAIAAEYFWPERRLENAHAALELVRKHDPELYEQLEEQIRAARVSGPNLQTMTYEAFQVMADAVDALWEQSLRTQQQLVDGQLMDRGEILGQLQARLDDINAPLRQEPRTRNQMLMLGARAALTRVEHWVDYVDGGNPQGPFRRFIWNPIAEATTKYRLARERYLSKYLELLKPIEKTLVPGAIAAPELGHTFESKAQLLHALLHTGNDSNFQKLLRGYQWGEVRDGIVDASKFRAFLDRMHRQGVVTKADWDFLQSVWDLLDESKAEAQQAHREMYGRFFSEITARPVPTPWGTYRGGYVPAIADPLQAADAAQRDEGAILGERDNAAMFPSTSRGFTKQRTENYAKPLALDLRLLPGHLDKVLRFIHIAPRVRDVGRLLWKWDMRERLNAYDPTAVIDLLVPWLQRTVQQRVSQPNSGWSGKAADQFFRTLRTRTGLNMMAGNVVNTLQQFTGWFPAAVKVKPRYLRNAMYRYVTAHKAALDLVMSSEFMSTRTTAQAFAIQKTIDDLLLNPSQYEQLRDFANKHGYFLQQGTQNIVDVITWLGAYEQATVEQSADHADAVRQADAAVRMTQGSFAPEDLAAIDTKSAFTRTFVMFYGYFNMLANLNAGELAQVARDLGLRKGAGRALYIYAFGFMLPAVLSEAIRGAIGGFEADDDESWIDEFLWLFFGSQGRQLTAMVPGGQVVNSVANYFNDRPYDDRISASPAITMIESATRAPKSVYDAIVEDKSAKRAVRDFLSALGLLTGLPVGAVARPAGYLADVVDEKESPDDALELARGLVTGRGSDQDK